MARAARLKVYRTSAGFEDAYVAAPSQVAALKAWGARGDLFGLGEAEVVTDEALTAEPLARPGEVIRRPRGNMAAMLAAAPRPKPPTGAQKNASGGKPSTAPPPDRTALDAAEKAVSDARERLAFELGAIAQERAELDAQEARARREGEADVKRLDRARAAAERAFRKAGR